MAIATTRGVARTRTVEVTLPRHRCHEESAKNVVALLSRSACVRAWSTVSLDSIPMIDKWPESRREHDTSFHRDCVGGYAGRCQRTTSAIAPLSTS